MGISYNPSVVGDGLVFYYDMANTQKSWKGEPTTNFYTNGHFSGGNHVVEAQGGVLSNPVNEIVLFENPGDSPYCLRTTAVGGSPFTEYEMSATGLQPNTTYTMSCWYAWSPDWNGTSEIFHSRWFTSTGTEAGATGGSGTLFETRTINGMRWNRAFHSFTTGADVNGQHSFYAGYPAQNTTGFRYFTNFMLHQGSYIVPFVNGTRSNTQAILDLVGNKTITANSLTYNSDNTFSFNGAGQKLNVSNLSSFGNNATWMAWIKCTNGSASAYNMFMGRYLPYFSFYNGDRLYFSNTIDGAQRTIETPANLTTNTWYHAAFTTSYNGTNTTMKIYTNGVETANSSFVGAQGSEGAYNFVVGDGEPNNWYRFNGNVPTVQVYNRTLSATEVYNNFIALKSRYGL